MSVACALLRIAFNLSLIRRRHEATLPFVLEEVSKRKEQVNKWFESKERITFPQQRTWNAFAQITVEAETGLKNLNLYLECNKLKASRNLAVSVDSEYRLLHRTAREKSLKYATKSVFSNDKTCWGFKPFVALDKLLDPAEGFYDPLADSVTFEIHFKTRILSPTPTTPPTTTTTTTPSAATANHANGQKQH